MRPSLPRALALALLLTAAPLQADEAVTAPVPTKLAIDRNGIKVWTYQTPDTPAFNYRATTRLPGSVTAVAALLVSPEEAPKWAPHVRRLTVLSPPDAAGVAILHMELDMPFPLSDRDIVIRAQRSLAADGSFTLRSRSVQDARAPEQPGMVRVQDYQGSWSVRAVEGGQVEVTTSGYANPGGYLPLTFVNMFVQQQPYEMLRDLQAYLKDRGDKAGLAMVR